MRVVVTGAAGHIGSALIREPILLGGADELVLLDDFSTQRYPSVFNLPAEGRYVLHEGDVLRTFTRELSAQADIVIHLAGMTDMANSFADSDATTQHNVKLTEHVAGVCQATNTAMVFVSSTSVYTPTSALVDEASTEVQPTSPYSQCKLREEAAVRRGFDEGLRGIIFRLGTIYGVSPGMRFHTAVNKFCWQAATGQPLQVWATAMDQVRPYLSVRDAVGAFAKTALEGIFPNRTVNLASCNVTVRDIVQAIEHQGLDPNVELVDSPAMNSLSYGVSCELADGYGFTLETSLNDGVSETLAILAGLLRSRSSTWGPTNTSPTWPAPK